MLTWVVQGWPLVWAQWWRTLLSTAGSPPCRTGCCWQAEGAAPSRADPASVLPLWHWPSGLKRSSLTHWQQYTVELLLINSIYEPLCFHIYARIAVSVRGGAKYLCCWDQTPGRHWWDLTYVQTAVSWEFAEPISLSTQYWRRTGRRKSIFTLRESWYNLACTISVLSRVYIFCECSSHKGFLTRVVPWVTQLKVF